MRTMLLSTLALLFTVLASPAAAQGFRNPHAVLFDVLCDLNDDGSLESSFQVVTFLNATGTARDVASQATFTAMSGIATGTLNGEVIFVSEIPARRGQGLRTVACEATSTLIDEEGNVLVLTITDARFLMTPPAAPH